MGEAVLSDQPSNNELRHEKPVSDVSSEIRPPRPEDDPRIVSHDPDLSQFLSFARTLLVPMFVWKVCMLYFGLNYSMYPGEGYGYGLVASISLSLAGFAFFLWKNRSAK